MSRSGYGDGADDNWSMIKWRGQVASAIRGRRGQVFLRDMLAALDAMTVKRLIRDDLVHEGDVCALGAVGIARHIDMSEIDPHDCDTVANKFGIATPLACEIMYMNDEQSRYRRDTPEERWERMRSWVASLIREE